MVSKKVVGALLLTFLVGGGVLVLIQDSGIKFQIDKTKTTISIKNGTTWSVSGVEYNALYSGTKLIARNTSSGNIETMIDSKTNITTIIRYNRYKSDAVIIDTYRFYGNTQDKEAYPIYHTVEVYNATGSIYQYEINKLKCSGTTVDNVQSPQSFNDIMKVEWQRGYYNTLTSACSLKVKYKINTTYEMFQFKLLDQDKTRERPKLLSETKQVETFTIALEPVFEPDTTCKPLIVNGTYVAYSKECYYLKEQKEIKTPTGVEDKEVQYLQLGERTFSVPEDYWCYGDGKDIKCISKVACNGWQKIYEIPAGCTIFTLIDYDLNREPRFVFSGQEEQRILGLAEI